MLIVRARAKLNLGLAITRRRDDGWHELDSLVVPIDWHDTVGVALRPGRSGVTLTVSGRTSGVPLDESNLAYRAAVEAAALFDQPVELVIWLHKRLPNAAGLGGGSSDAAAVLRCCVRLARTVGPSLDIERVAGIARALGSDIPVLLANRPMRMMGTGGEVEPADVVPRHAVVAVAGESATAATYHAFDPSREAEDSSRIDRLCAAARAGTLGDDALGSGLEAAACRINAPLRDSLQRLRDETDRRWHLTGSGGAAFALARTARDAAELAERCKQLGYEARTVETGGQ